MISESLNPSNTEVDACTSHVDLANVTTTPTSADNVNPGQELPKHDISILFLYKNLRVRKKENMSSFASQLIHQA